MLIHFSISGSHKNHCYKWPSQYQNIIKLRKLWKRFRKKIVKQDEEGWETVSKKGTENVNKKDGGQKSPEKQKTTFVLPINNRFAQLAENIKENNSDSREDSDKYSCKGCSFIFQSKNTLEDHKRSAHCTKLSNSDNEGNKDKIIQDLKQQLSMEKRAKNEASHAYVSLEQEYRACESVVSVIQEENTRLKIENKDLKTVLKLNKAESNQNSPEKELDNGIHMCKECGYPFNQQLQLDMHMKKHNSIRNEVQAEHKCYLCNQIFSSRKSFGEHITVDHIEYNCNQFSFQAGTKMVLAKHINLSHKKEVIHLNKH